MDILNPTLNAPVLPPPSSTKRFRHSRSPSASPTRPYSPLGFDPLLRCLSPTSTLQAFTTSAAISADSRSPSPRRRELKASFSNVSSEQKELGSKAAQACLDIRSWTRELEGWEWPGCFEEPEPARKRVRVSILSIGSLASAKTQTTLDDAEATFWGSLPATTVRDYDERLQEISTQLDEVDLEALKDYTLESHQNSPRIGSDENAEPAHTVAELKRLDDYTAVVTATILQTLPFVSKLMNLLDTWYARIAILKDIPSFLDDLEQMRTDLDHGWAAVAVSLRKNGEFAMLGAANMREMQNLIDAKMTSLGQRLDGFLDLLEGREDCVPDSFLDKFEELEERYAEWVVMAQQRVLGDELKSFESDVASSSPVTITRSESIDRSKTPTVYDASTERAKTPILHELAVERAKTPVFLDANIERARTPSIHNVAVLASVDDAATPVMAVPEQEDEEIVDLAGIESSHHNVPETKETRELNGITALPQIPIVVTASPGPAEAPKLRPTSSHTQASRTASPTRSARHVPIILPFDGDGSEYQASPHASFVQLPHPDEVKNDTARTSIRPSADVARPSTSPNHVERQSSLQKQSRSPTRTLASAGNRLTRLFKRDKDKDKVKEKPTEVDRERVSRSDSGSIFRGRRSISRKRDTKTSHSSVVWGGRPPSPAKSSEEPMPEINLPADPEQPLDSTPSTTTIDDVDSTKREHMETLQKLSGAERPSRPATAIRPTTSGTIRIATRPETYQPKRLDMPSSSPKEPAFPENWPLIAAPTHAASAVANQQNIGNNVRSSFQPRESVDSQPSINLRSVSAMSAIDMDAFQNVFIDGLSLMTPPAETANGVEPPMTAERAAEAIDRLKDVEPETPTDIESIAETDGEVSVLTATPPVTRKVPIPTVTSSMLSSDGRQDDLSVARAISVEGLRQFDTAPAVPQHNLKERHTAQLRDDRISSLPMVTDEDVLTPEDDGSIHDASIAYFPAPSRDAVSIKTSSRPASVSATSPRANKRFSDSSLADLEYPPPLPPTGSTPLTATAPLKFFDAEEQPQAEKEVKGEDADYHERKNLIKRASTASIKAHTASEVRSIDVPARKRSPSKPNTTTSSESQTPAFESAPETRANSMSYFTRPAYSRTSTRSGAVSPTGSIDTPNFSRLRASSVDAESRSPSTGISVNKVRRKEPALETIKPSGEFSAEDIDRAQVKQKIVPADEFDRQVSQVLEKLPAPIRFQSRQFSQGNLKKTDTKLSGDARPKNALLSRRSSGADSMTLAPAEAAPKRRSPGEAEIKLYHLTQAGRDEPIKLFVRLVGEGERVMVRVGGGWSDLADFLKQYAEHHGSRTVSESGQSLQVLSTSSTPAGSRRTSGAVTGSAKNGGTSSRNGSEPTSPASPLSDPLDTSRVTRPPTANGNSSRPGSRAGNRLVKKQYSKEALSDQKAKWVQGMLEKAKRETAAAKDGKSESFSELGKVGTTRRVFFRSASAMSGTSTAEDRDGQKPRGR